MGEGKNPGVIKNLGESVREKPMLTAREVATELGMSEAWVRKGCRDGSIPAVRVGEQGSWRVARQWVQRVLNGEQSVVVVETVRPVIEIDGTNLQPGEWYTIDGSSEPIRMSSDRR